MIEAQLVQNQTLREDLWFKDLPHGLKAYVLRKPGFSKTMTTFSTNYGSIDNHFVVPNTDEELRVPDGIAHFLEHQMFAMEYGDAFERFSALGAQANAYTNYNGTTYLFSATDAFEESLELLLDFVQHPYFTEEGVNKEKGIIEQEVRMYRDAPNWRVLSNLLEAMYFEHPVKIDIGGTVESVNNINRDLLYKCYNTFYHPGNMVIFVVGDVEPEDIFNQIERNLLKREYPAQGEIKRIFPDEPDEVREKLVVEEMVVSEALFRMGFKDVDVNLEPIEHLKKIVVTEILLESIFGHSSSLYEELYDSGLIDDSFSAHYMVNVNYGISIMGGNTEKPEELAEALLMGIKQVREQGVTEEDFLRVRNRSLGEYISAFDSIDSIAYIFNTLHFQEISLFDYLEVLSEVTLDDVNKRVREHLVSDRHVVSIVKPK